MARRRATRKYESLFDFVKDYSKSLSTGAINLPAGSFRGELANEIKLDLSIPDFGRIGPIVAQVIFRDPSGSVALRLPNLPADLHETYSKAKIQCTELAQPYVDAGFVVFKEEHDSQVQELEAQLLSQKSEWEKKLEDAIAKLQAETEAKLAALKEELEAQKAAAPVVQIDRGIPIVDFSGLDTTAEGNMIDLPGFLMEAGKKQWTGLLYIDQGVQRRFAYFDKGAVVAWRSDPLIEKEALGILLYSFKQITEEQLQQSLTLMEEKGIRQGEAFVELGVMNFPQMVTVLSKQVEFILQQVRKQKKGEFSFYKTPLPEKFLSNKLYFINLLMRDLRAKSSRLGTQALFKNLTPNFGKKVFLDSELLPILRFGSFTPPERKTLQMIQKRPIMLRDLMKTVPLPKTEINSFFWMLNELGALAFDTQRKESKSPIKTIHIRPEVLANEKIQELEKGTHFDRLGLHWICVNADVERQFTAEKKRIEALKERQEYEMISLGLQEAYEILISPEERRSYRDKLFHQKFLKEAALLLAQEGEKAISSKNKVLACRCFVQAIDLCPDEMTYKEGLKRAALA